MKILFCSPVTLSKARGIPKTLIEIREELEQLGWECKILEPSEIFPKNISHQNYSHDYHKYLKAYLIKNSSQYDVVEYDYRYLPYSRKEFNHNTLFVARSQLLIHHLKNIKIPQTKGIRPLKKGWKSYAHSLLFGNYYDLQLKRMIQMAHITACEADIVIVLNHADKAELVKSGIPSEKLFVIPNGISKTQRSLLSILSSKPPLLPMVAFIGTFDNRKGATDFSKIVENICNHVPGVKFRLLGTAGLYKTKEEVLGNFPSSLRNCLEVIPSFKQEDLPELLAPCSVGIFPSYLEAFGLGVLEMLTASLPVIAYNSPGPPMMLPPEYLVTPGDTNSMSNKVIELLHNKEKLTASRIWARQKSQRFCWQQIAQELNQVYIKHLLKDNNANLK